MVVFLLLSCSWVTRWETISFAPNKINIQDINLLDDGSMLIAGYFGNSYSSNPGDARIWRIGPEGRRSIWLEPTAEETCCLVHDGENVWSEVYLAPTELARSLGSTGDPTLYQSTDSGKTWEYRGIVPVLAGKPAVASDHSLWYTNGKRVFRSTDDGISWNERTFPFKESFGYLVPDKDEMVMVGQPTLYRTKDGRTWTEEPLDAAVHWLDDRYYAGQKDDRPVFAKRGPTLTWLPIQSARGKVLKFTSNGDNINALVLRRTGEISHTIDLMHSDDAGHTWTRETSSIASSKGQWDIHPDGRVALGDLWRPNLIYLRRPDDDGLLELPWIGKPHPSIYSHTIP